MCIILSIVAYANVAFFTNLKLLKSLSYDHVKKTLTKSYKINQ